MCAGLEVEAGEEHLLSLASLTRAHYFDYFHVPAYPSSAYEHGGENTQEEGTASPPVTAPQQERWVGIWYVWGDGVGGEAEGGGVHHSLTC
jgi:hypothetical protein